jgi:hypothetical protein
MKEKGHITRVISKIENQEFKCMKQTGENDEKLPS